VSTLYLFKHDLAQRHAWSFLFYDLEPERDLVIVYLMMMQHDNINSNPGTHTHTRILSKIVALNIIQIKERDCFRDGGRWRSLRRWVLSMKDTIYAAIFMNGQRIHFNFFLKKKTSYGTEEND